MSIQGNWAGDYQGEWFGSSGGPGPDYKIAGLVVTGSCQVTFGAEVINPTPPSVGGGGFGGSGGHAGSKLKLEKRREFEELLTKLTEKPLLTEADKCEILAEVGESPQATPAVTDDDEELAAVFMLLL